MCRKLALALSLAVVSGAFGADVPAATTVPAAPSENGDEFNIAITADAAKKKERAEKIELYSKCRGGDAASRKMWENMKRAERTAILADVVGEPGESPLRSNAIKELATQSPSEDPDGTALLALAQCAVREKDGALRALARNGLAARQDDRTAKLLVPALAHDNVLFRDNAAAALKAVGGPRVFEVIIEHWKEFWGPGNRGFVFIGQQRSYVANYDINGDSYDPVVRNFMTGVCLDVKSLKVEGDIWYKTIREIAPDDVKLPANAAAWEKWVDKNRDKLTADSAKRCDAARAALADE